MGIGACLTTGSWSVVAHAIRDPVKFLIPVSFLMAFSYLAMGSYEGGTGFLTLAAPKSGTGFLNMTLS